MLGRLRIRGKLVLLVVIPLLAVVGLTVPVVLDRIQLAGRAADTAEAVRIAARIGALVQDIQQERFLAVGLLVRVADTARVEQQIKTVDDHTSAVRTDSTLTLPKAVDDALGGVRELQPLRSSVLAGQTTPDKVITGYGAVVTRLIDALRLEGGVDVKTTEGRQVVALDAALRTDEGITVGTTYLLLLAATKNPQLLVPYYANFTGVQLWIARFTTYATAQQLALYNQTQAELTGKLGNAFADPANVDPIQALSQVPLAALFPGLQSVVGVNRAVEDKIVADVTKTVGDRQRNALTIAYVVSGLSLLVLLGAVFLSAAVARAVVRPLTRLTASADRVARVAEAELVRVADDEAEAPAAIHLEAVDVGAKDEVGDLARAFERVQGTATRLVERQVASRRNVAQMFGHVGRRTQNLVARQVALIDRLERDETDPERLQNLYRLDHVSSRLRRNAGSLVVLSGAVGVEDQVSPLPLIDAVRLALGEIEDYTRVDLHIPGDVALVPSFANDMVLVLAELMENATVFSPPHVRVTVSAQYMPYGIQLAEVDHGIGMTDERLVQENARLERRERLDLAPTEVLGLFVVGRLARRHDLRVILTATPGGGVTAMVEINRHLLTDAPVAPLYLPAQPLPRPLTSAPLPPPAAPQPVSAPPVPHRDIVLAGFAPSIFDEAAVDRANRSIAQARPWSAFVPHHRVGPPDELAWPPAQPAQPAPQAPPAQRRPVQPEYQPAPQPVYQPAPAQWADPTPSSPARPPLIRRKPGETLEALQGSSPVRLAEQLTPPDPEEARSLVEQFEAGVTRALRDAGPSPEHGEGSRA